MKTEELIKFLEENISSEIKDGDEIKFLSHCNGEDLYVQIFRRKTYFAGQDEKVFGVQRYLTRRDREYFENEKIPLSDKKAACVQLYKLMSRHVQSEVAHYERILEDVERRKKQIVWIKFEE